MSKYINCNLVISGLVYRFTTIKRGGPITARFHQLQILLWSITMPLYPFGLIACRSHLLSQRKILFFVSLVILQTGGKLTQKMLIQVPKGVGSPGVGRNKTEIVLFQLQRDITSFQLYCLNRPFERSLLGQSAGHKRVGTVSRHIASCLVSLGNRTSGLTFFVMRFHQRQSYPVSDASQTAAKWFQNRSHGLLIWPHSFLFKGRLLKT